MCPHCLSAFECEARSHTHCRSHSNRQPSTADAFLSTWLRERKSAAGLTKKQRKKARSDLFTAGNKAYQDCLFRGGVEVERLKCVGAAGAQACSAGAAAFGGLKK